MLSWDLDWGGTRGGNLSILALGAGAVCGNGLVGDDGGEGWDDWDDGTGDLAVWAVGHGWGAGGDGLNAGLVLSKDHCCLDDDVVDHSSWESSGGCGGGWLDSGRGDLELVRVLEDLWVGVELDLDAVDGERGISWDGPGVLPGGGWNTGYCVVSSRLSTFGLLRSGAYKQW